jgi:hypothetical protein
MCSPGDSCAKTKAGIEGSIDTAKMAGIIHFKSFEDAIFSSAKNSLCDLI